MNKKDCTERKEFVTTAANGNLTQRPPYIQVERYHLLNYKVLLCYKGSYSHITLFDSI